MLAGAVRGGRQLAPAQAALWAHQCWRQDAEKKRCGWPSPFLSAQAVRHGEDKAGGGAETAKANEPAAEAKPRTSPRAIGRPGVRH